MQQQREVKTTVCLWVRERFADFDAGTLDPESHGRVRGHLLSCRPCALALGDSVAEAMTPELRATLQRPMPPPPAAIREALGIQSAGEGVRWAALQALAAESSGWAKAEWERIRATMQQWLQELASAPSPAFTTRGTADWPRQLGVPVMDAVGQSLGRTAHFQVVQPPAVTKAGEFVCILHTSEPGFAGGSLRCTVAAPEEVKVTFTGECAQAARGSWVVVIRAAGLPTLAELLVIPDQSVEFSVVVHHVDCAG